MTLFRDHSGDLILPGRVTRAITDPVMSIPAALPYWQTAAAGTMTYGTFTGANSIGWAKNTSGPVSGNAAAIKAVSPLNAIQPNNFTHLRLDLESLVFDADTGMDFEMGFQGNSNKGGCSILHLNGASNAIVRVKDASSVITDYAISYNVFQGSGGGRKRRNLTLILIPNGFPGGPRQTSAFVFEDDAEIAAVPLTSGADMTWATCPLWQVVTREAAAHSVQWGQARLTIGHN